MILLEDPGDVGRRRSSRPLVAFLTGTRARCKSKAPCLAKNKPGRFCMYARPFLALIARSCSFDSNSSNPARHTRFDCTTVTYDTGISTLVTAKQATCSKMAVAYSTFTRNHSLTYSSITYTYPHNYLDQYPRHPITFYQYSQSTLASPYTPSLVRESLCAHHQSSTSASTPCSLPPSFTPSFAPSLPPALSPPVDPSPRLILPSPPTSSRCAIDKERGDKPLRQRPRVRSHAHPHSTSTHAVLGTRPFGGGDWEQRAALHDKASRNP